MTPLSNRALQSLRNEGNESEEAAEEIEVMRSRIAELEKRIARMKTNGVARKIEDYHRTDKNRE